MSFADRLVLWLHIGFAIFTIGPVTAAIMSTPRSIRQRNLVVVRYLYRTTRLFAIFSLGVLIAGLVLARLRDDYSKPWLTVSLTLFVVSLVLLVLIMRDQHRAIAALEDAQAPRPRSSPPARPRPRARPARARQAPRPRGPGLPRCRAARPTRARTPGTWSAAGSPRWAAWSA